MPKEPKLLKKKRAQWVAMVEQLRFGSPVAPQIQPGQCQDMLDFLVKRYWPFARLAPILRFDKNQIAIEQATAAELWVQLPDEEWARKERAPHSEINHPIFLKSGSNLIYLDGRRRINKWYRDNPKQLVKYWVIYEI